METNQLYLLGTKEIATQTVLTDGVISIGNVYRRYCRKNRCGTKVFDATNTGVTLNWDGMYHITATLVGTGTEAGDVTVQLYENGQPITGAVSTETITTPTTEFRTFIVDYFVLVDQSCVLGCNSTVAKTITLENVGVGATFTSVVVNIEKEA